MWRVFSLFWTLEVTQKKVFYLIVVYNIFFLHEGELHKLESTPCGNDVVYNRYTKYYLIT
jgi:hypothetical protein